MLYISNQLRTSGKAFFLLCSSVCCNMGLVMFTVKELYVMELKVTCETLHVMKLHGSHICSCNYMIMKPVLRL